VAKDSRQGALDSGRTITSDQEGVIFQWGDAFREALGYSADEAIGRKVDLIIPPVLHPLHWRGFNKAMANGHLRWHRSISEVKVPALHKDGRIIPLHATLELTHGVDGRGHGAVATILDTGAAWRGTAWRIALAPLNFAQRLRKGLRQSRSSD
jgi:PAS domain S-box-containing protein